MKKYLYIILFVGVCFGQDVLVLKTNEKYEGKYLGINLFDVSFMPEKTKFAQNIPIKRIKHVILADGSSIKMHVPPERPSGKISQDELSKMTKKWLEEQKRKECDENSKKSVVVLPLKDDIYGITEEIAHTLEKECYDNKSNLPILKIITQEKINLNNVNDYQLKKLANDNDTHLIVFGYLYTIDVPFMYTADPSSLSSYDPKIDNSFISNLRNDYANTWTDILADVLAGYERGRISLQNKKSKKKYEQSAGTWLYGTIFTINSESGEKVFLFKNKVLRKL